MQAGSGTQFAPFVVALFDDPEVTDGLRELLTEGRDENYRKTYRVLKEL